MIMKSVNLDTAKLRPALFSECCWESLLIILNEKVTDLTPQAQAGKHHATQKKN